MARKGWDRLKSDYRERLERNGISRSDYENGVSLKKARSHEKTPERPRNYNAELFQEYHQSREALTARLVERKRELFGDTPADPKHGPRWNPERSAQYIRDYSPPLRLMRWALEASTEELLDAIRDDPETYAFLGYH